MHDPLPPALRAALSRLDPRLALATPTALAGGRTNRVWHLGDLVAKSYRAGAATALFPNDPAAEARALARFAPLGLAPRLRAAGPDWLIYDHLPGPVWSGDPAPVAQTLHRLHSTPGVTGFRPLPNGTAALRQDALRVAGGLALPPLPATPDLPPVPPRPVHADAVAGNLVLSPQCTVLIDWQCPGLGDPAEDLATFLSPLMQHVYTGRVLDAHQRARFLASYPDRATVTRFLALEPLYHWRLMAHCATRAAQGEADYAQALRLALD